jgi:hypothetical protein
MRWIRLAAVGMLAVCLAVPTVAVAVDGVQGDIHLEPTSSYATTTDDGQLELDFDALNDRATSTFDDVFEITVTDEAVERIWLSDAPAGVQFYQDGDPTAAVDERAPLEPTPGESTAIGVAIDTHRATPSSETFTVHVEYEDEEAADVRLVDVDVSERDLEAGETLTVAATYENRGDGAGSTTAELVVDGTVVDSQVVHLEAGDTETVTFERKVQQSGTFDVGIDDRKPQAVTVCPACEGGADFNVTAVELEDDAVAQGEPAVVTATIENTGNATDAFLAELAVGGIVVEDRSVELEPGEETTTSFEWRFDEPGTYDLAVSGVEAGSVTVEESAGYEILNRDLDPAAVAVVGPPAVVGCLFLAGVVTRRWNL